MFRVDSVNAPRTNHRCQRCHYRIPLQTDLDREGSHCLAPVAGDGVKTRSEVLNELLSEITKRSYPAGCGTSRAINTTCGMPSRPAVLWIAFVGWPTPLRLIPREAAARYGLECRMWVLAGGEIIAGLERDRSFKPEKLLDYCAEVKLKAKLLRPYLIK